MIVFILEDLGFVLKCFEVFDEVCEMEFGCFEIVYVGGLMIGCVIYCLGWKWFEYVGKVFG